MVCVCVCKSLSCFFLSLQVSVFLLCVYHSSSFSFPSLLPWLCFLVHACCCFTCVQLFATYGLCNLCPLSMGFSRQEYCSVLPCPPPGSNPCFSLLYQAGSLPLESPGKPLCFLKRPQSRTVQQK